MARIRSLIFNGFFFAWTALMLLVMWLALPLRRAAMQRFVRLWGEGNRAALRYVVGLDYEIRGKENMPAGPAIVACKHQSAWETMFFHSVFPDPAYVLKQELSRIPLWGVYARKCQAVIVNRSGGASALKALVRDARRALGDGQQIVIFPEGTRAAPGSRQPYHPGVAALYTQCCVPAVPVALNSGLFWGRRSFAKRSGTIVIEFLPPIAPGLDRRTFMAELADRIESATARLEAEAVDALGSPETGIKSSTGCESRG